MVGRVKRSFIYDARDPLCGAGFGSGCKDVIVLYPMKYYTKIKKQGRKLPLVFNRKLVLNGDPNRHRTSCVPCRVAEEDL
jgi:hypothetical protein